MQFWPDAIKPEEHDAEEAGFEEEGGQHLVSHQRPDDRSGLVGKDAPVGAELVGHDDAGDDAHAEGDREDRFPEVEEFEVDLGLFQEPQTFQDREVARKADGKSGKDDVEGDGEGELEASEQGRIETLKHGRNPFRHTDATRR
ncbi:hypothetical protein D9M68_352990 [compost metagenome]